MNNEILLCRADGIIEAEMIVEILKDNNIPAYYKNNSPLQIMEHIRGDISQEQLIFINEQDSEAAKALLAEYEQSAALPDEE